ncbi:MAG: gamma-glutamyl-gamma-aminobutyrate hydrolase family protein [Clostridium sp.]|nr:gamma-glutamyl-gamma-aminobutyrate hydrolase family protein [Clostridium sp.]MCM1444422.1 gamma-glutamyl-gamma-aminobutyrate hydrolase family protein [Candidatus Amulumruptor caecigallinarius]
MIKIGVVSRIDKTQNNNVYVFNKELCDYLIKKNIEIIPIISYDENLIKMCDGFILPGGDSKTIDFLIIKYCLEYNIPLLGICLGMQSIGEYFNGEIVSVSNHYSKDRYIHSIEIDNKSLLYKIIKSMHITVNSRHHDKLINPNIFVSAYSSDGVIEAIEDQSKTFIVGVQWHPESMIDYDIIQVRLIDRFIDACKGDNNEFI